MSARKNNKIGVGDLVMVSYPMGEQTNNPAHKFDGEEFVVKVIRRVRESKNTKVTRNYTSSSVPSVRWECRMRSWKMN